MGTETRARLSDRISDLCEQAGCNEKITKIHRTQYVDRGWNPHPSQKFVNWWGSGGALECEKRTGRGWKEASATVAFNCEAVREIYLELKKFNIGRVALTSPLS